jgi:7-cyano-7-deazaguanine reductase
MSEKKIKATLKKQIKSPDIIRVDVIEVVDYEYSKKRDAEIKIENEEFTSICPRTGLPDFGKLEIRYIPDTLLIELKSLKYYLLQYRNIGIFYEHTVNKVLEDLIPLVKPKWMIVIGTFNVRGGIKTTVKAEYRSESSPYNPDPRD